MKVLHLPSNIASQTSVTVRALRDIGIEARGLTKSRHAIEDVSGIDVLPPKTGGRFSPRRLLRKYTVWQSVLSAIRWADVIHWHYVGGILPMDLDLKYIAYLNKARIVEFWGSDIRIPEIASADNPYTERMYRHNPDTGEEKAERSIEAQRRFARYGFQCLVPDCELEAYIQTTAFPSFYKTRARLMVSEFTTSYPEAEKKCPVIVHAPSHKGKKGTDVIVSAIDRLRSGYTFEFHLIYNVEHSRAMKMVRDCDIMIDELVSGTYGLAALEAMAFGKPTICYQKPAVVAGHPADCPIVNANQDNIAEVLTGLIQDGPRRRQIGLESRKYVEKYHDAHRIAKDLVGIYQDLIAKVQHRKSDESVSIPSIFEEGVNEQHEEIGDVQ